MKKKTRKKFIHWIIEILALRLHLLTIGARWLLVMYSIDFLGVSRSLKNNWIQRSQLPFAFGFFNYFFKNCFRFEEFLLHTLSYLTEVDFNSNNDSKLVIFPWASRCHDTPSDNWISIRATNCCLGYCNFTFVQTGPAEIQIEKAPLVTALASGCIQRLSDHDRVQATS